MLLLVILVLIVDFDDFSRRSNVAMWCAVSVNARLNVNVALNRPAYQVDTYNDGGGPFIASYANDGNHDPHMQHLHCAHTDGQNTGAIPWWAVDLGVALYVHSVKFTNRDVYGTLLCLQCLQCRPYTNCSLNSFECR